jgi:beta-N-acetylhexosaminidase
MNAAGSLLILGIAGPELTADEVARIRRLQPAGFILFTRNLVSAEQTRQLTDALRDLSQDEPILAIDEEGGRVSRLHAIAAGAPAPPALVSSGGVPTIARAAAITGDLLRLLGINLNLAPVLDLAHDPDAANALQGRCWSRDPQRVIDHAGHWNRWLRKRSVATCVKHFPAGGRARCDPHHDLPTSDASLEELLRDDIIPYTALMPEIDAVMLAHVLFPKLDDRLPASLSPRVVQRLLRDQLGFDDHLVLTDDLDMDAIAKRYRRGEDARLAIEAGNDLALICHRTESADEAATALEALPHRITDEAIQRVEQFKRRKLHPPLAWSESHWTSVCAQMAELQTTCIGEPDADPGQVARY